MDRKICHANGETCYGSIDSTGVAWIWLKKGNIRIGTLRCHLFDRKGRVIVSFRENGIGVEPWAIKIRDRSVTTISEISLHHSQGLLRIGPFLGSLWNIQVRMRASYSYEEVIEVNYGGRGLRSLDAPWME